MTEEVDVTTRNAHPEPPARGGASSVDELARAKGLSVAATIETPPDVDVFDSDDEVEEFLAFVAEQRRASLA